MSKKVERRPFHETVVDIIAKCWHEDEEFLAELINATKIPKNHDAIIAAWQQFQEKLTRSTPPGEEQHKGDDYYGVIEILREQKQEAEAEAKTKTAAEDKRLAALCRKCPMRLA